MGQWNKCSISSFWHHVKVSKFHQGSLLSREPRIAPEHHIIHPPQEKNKYACTEMKDILMFC